MLRYIFVILLLISAVLISGCTEEPTGEAQLSSAQAEDQAADMIEQEMNKAIEGIDIADIENSILE